jgi:hypothetical protein
MRDEGEPLVHIHTCFYLNEYTCDERNKNAAERKITMGERETSKRKCVFIYEYIFKSNFNLYLKYVYIYR